MNIQAKAKPVRFRIVSGGVECMTLEDLKKNFEAKSISDTVNDGRLAKWLRGINEGTLAANVEEIRAQDHKPTDKALKVLSLLTGKNYGEELFDSKLQYIEFLDSEKCTRGIALDMITSSIKTDLDILLYTYHYHRDMIPSSSTISYFGTFLDRNNPAVLWIYGRELMLRNQEEKGLQYIQKAAEMGYDEAIKFVETHKGTDKQMLMDIAMTIMGKNAREWRNQLNMNQTAMKKEFSKYIASDDFTSQDKDYFMLCRSMCELLDRRSMDEVKWRIFDIKRNQCEQFGVCETGFYFLYIYANERTKTLSEYQSLNYSPALQRAEDLKHSTRNLFIKTRSGKEITMWDDPTRDNYLTFVYDFLTNYFDF